MTKAGYILAMALCAAVPGLAQVVQPVKCNGDLGGTSPNCIVTSVAHVSTGVLSSTNGGTGLTSLVQPRPWTIEGRNYIFGKGASGSAGTDIAIMSRMCYTSTAAFTQLRLAYFGTAYTNSAGVEGAIPNPFILRASLEYPVGTVATQIAVSGKTTWVLQPYGNIASDPVGAQVPANTAFCIRSYERVATPPTSPSVAVSAAAGLLSTSTNYFYKVTSIDNGVESGPTSEVTCATSSSTSCKLSWTVAANATPSFYNIYRGTVSGTDLLIATIAAPVTAWVDLGLTTASTQAPPAAQNLIYNGNIVTGNSSTGNGGTTADTTASTGVIATHAGPGNNFVSAPFEVLTNNTSSHPVIAFGDSIQAGVGPNITTNLASGNYQTTNWFDLGFANGAYSSSNISVPGSTCANIANQSYNSSSRWPLLAFGTRGYVVSNLGRNDLYGGSSWTTVATCLIALGNQIHALGLKFYGTTITPNTTSTDNFVTAANQTLLNNTNEASRAALNTWWRNGMLVNAGTPCNTAACGTATTAADGFFDLANAIGEVNSSNVLTLNGGFWPANAATFTGLILNGSPTTTAFAVTTTPFTQFSHGGDVICMTSGAQNGNCAAVSSAPTTSTLTLFANGASRPSTGTYVGLTGAPAAGDTFNLYKVQAADGIHPTTAGHAAAGAAFATWVASNLAP